MNEISSQEIRSFFSLFGNHSFREINLEERSRISNAHAQMNTALLFVAQKYSNIVLGTGLKQFHHFYWIEGNDGDPLTKRREIIPYSGRVSRTLIDRGYAEVGDWTVKRLSNDSVLRVVVDYFCNICGVDYIRKKRFRNYSSRNRQVKNEKIFPDFAICKSFF